MASAKFDVEHAGPEFITAVGKLCTENISHAAITCTDDSRRALMFAMTRDLQKLALSGKPAVVVFVSATAVNITLPRRILAGENGDLPYDVSTSKARVVMECHPVNAEKIASEINTVFDRLPGATLLVYVDRLDCIADEHLKKLVLLLIPRTTQSMLATQVTPAFVRTTSLFQTRPRIIECAIARLHNVPAAPHMSVVWNPDPNADDGPGK